MKKKLLVITQYFYPENFRINDMCVEWVKRDYDVTVLSGIPNYPIGDIYDGYERKYSETEWNGIHVVRVPMYPRGHNYITLARNCYSFVNFSKKWIDNVAKRNSCKLPFDTIFTFEVSPMTQALIGAYAGKKYNVKSILYVQDLWPENLIEIMGIKSPFIIKPIEAMVKKIYNDTNIIFTTSNSFINDIEKYIYDISLKKKVHYWPQYAEDFYKPIAQDRFNLKFDKNNKLRICFTGNIGRAQGLDVLCDTAKLLSVEYNNKNIPINFKFVIVGDGRYKSNFLKILSDNNVSHLFEFVGKVKAEEIPKVLSTCHMGFISFKNCELFAKTIPAKLQSYLACGMPILASTIGETSKIVNEAQCGLVSTIGNPNDLKNNILNILDEKVDLMKMSINSRNYFEQNFTKEKLMNEMDMYL